MKRTEISLRSDLDAKKMFSGGILYASRRALGRLKEIELYSLLANFPRVLILRASESASMFIDPAPPLFCFQEDSITLRYIWPTLFYEGVN